MSTKIAPLEIRPVSDAAPGIVPKTGLDKVGKALVVQEDGSSDWTGALGSGVESQKAASLLEGLPYALGTDPSGSPVLSHTFGPALAGDVFLLEFYAEVSNENASAREVNGSLAIDGTPTQDSSAIPFGAASAVGSIQFFIMRLAVTLDADNESPTFSARIWASGSDVVAPQVCFSVTKLGQ